MARTTPFVLLLVFAGTVAASPVVLRPGDPSLDGKDYLISEQDFREILRLCRARLGSSSSKSVRDVMVLRRDTLAAYFGTDQMRPDFLWVFRTKDGWKIDRQGYGWWSPNLIDQH